MIRRSILSKAFFSMVWLLGFVSGEVLFHSDFECGETYLAKAVKPGQRKIHLVPNGNLTEWPEEGGTGIIEGNLPQTCEAFQYEKRKDYTLHGVKDLKMPHPKYADIRTGNLREWSDIRSVTKPPKSIVVSRKTPLFGNHSCAFFSETNKPSLLFQRLQKDLPQYHCRFYIRFSQEVLHSRMYRKRIAFWSSKRFSMQRVVVTCSGGKQDAFFELFPPVQGVTILRKDSVTDRIPIHPGKTHCVEYSFSMEDLHTAHVTLRVDGKVQAREYAKYDPIINNALCRLYLGKVDDHEMHGGFEVDEILVTDSSIGPLPETPVVLYQDGRLFLRDGGSQAHICPYKALQWNIHRDNGWMHPLHNTLREEGETCWLRVPVMLEFTHSIHNDSILPSPVRIPTGIEAGQRYFGRARGQGKDGQWSGWSEPLSFAINRKKPDPARPTPVVTQIREAFFAEAGERRPTSTIVKGTWYDLHIFPASRKGWEHLQFVDVNLCGTPEGCVGNHRNRGGVFHARDNYLISFALDIDRLFVKQNEGSELTMELKGVKGLYADGTTGAYTQHRKEGRIRLRVRLLPEARSGPWLLRACTGNARETISPFFEKALDVRDRAPAGHVDDQGQRWFWIVPVLLVMGVAAYTVLRKTKRHKQEPGRSGTTVRAERISPAYKANITKAREFILENRERNISAKDVAGAMGVSRKWLTDVFSKGMGTTLSHYIHKVKVDRAKELLVHNDLSVTEVAFQLGFNSHTHFWRVFHSIEGISPKEFREKHGKSG